MSEKLYEFSWDNGYGCLNGFFLAEETDVKNLIGKTLYFGDALGKHSSIEFELEEFDITLITDDQEFIEKAKKYNVAPSGYDPFDYIADEDEDEEDDDEEDEDEEDEDEDEDEDE